MNKNGFTSLITLVLIVLVLFFGVFILMQNTNTQNTLTPTPPSLSNNELYQQYMNQETPFQLSYPSYWTLEELLTDEAISNYGGGLTNKVVIFRGKEGNVWITWGKLPSQCSDYGNKKPEKVLLGQKQVSGCTYMLNDGRKHIEFFQSLKNGEVINFVGEIEKPISSNEEVVTQILDSLLINH